VGKASLNILSSFAETEYVFRRLPSSFTQPANFRFSLFHPEEMSQKIAVTREQASEFFEFRSGKWQEQFAFGSWVPAYEHFWMS
jgi:hypothetical protein